MSVLLILLVSLTGMDSAVVFSAEFSALTRMPLSSTSLSMGITRHLRPSMIRVSTRSARSDATWITTSGVLISNFLVLVILDATREDFSPAASSYCSSKFWSFSSSTPHSSKRRFTSDLVRTTGSGSSFWDSMRSLVFRGSQGRYRRRSHRRGFLQPER